MEKMEPEENSMIPKEVFADKDFQRCVDFHGHICPGLAIGYRAAKAGLSLSKEDRAGDEEIIAIVETDACGADAIQVLTGCTFGKGNLIYKDHGKNVFTLAGRKSGRGVRVALKPGVMELTERHKQLIEKLREDKATDEERQEFWELHRQKSGDILEKPLKELFYIQTVNPPIPPKARMEPSRPCSHCGEPTMGSKLERVQGTEVCKDCLGRIAK
jgi:formylmethanofuran dehydrogenase subunit E